GSSNACPADTKAASGTVCRSAAGVCDLAESCDGSSATCPADAFAPATTGCRSSTSACGVAEQCTGSSAAWPARPRPARRGGPGQPDGDADGVCDALDDCPAAPDPAQADSDGDGRGDACDPCNNVFNGGVFATKAKAIVTKLLTAPGDDKVKLKGYLVVPTAP